MRKHSSMVFQGYNLFKNKTALENVMEALTVVQKKSKAEAEKIALELLDKVGMSERKDFYPSKLSGGQTAESWNCKSTCSKSECGII